MGEGVEQPEMRALRLAGQDPALMAPMRAELLEVGDEALDHERPGGNSRRS